MIKSIIVDDEKLGRDTLLRLLEIHCPSVEVLDNCASAAEARESISKVKPDLIFLDIAMPGTTGIDLLREYKDLDFEIIFVTAHDEYILQAMRFSAIDYLLKPIDEADLKSAVGRAARRIELKSTRIRLDSLLHNMQYRPSKDDMQLCVPTSKGFQILKINSIVCCEAENTYTILHLVNNQQVVSTRPLIDYETMLEDVFFIRVHKSWIINMAHLKEYRKGEGGTAIMTNGKEIEVSRRRKDQFVSYLKQHFKN